MSGLRNFSGQY